jgi:hypothetical protein
VERIYDPSGTEAADKAAMLGYALSVSGQVYYYEDFVHSQVSQPAVSERHNSDQAR